MLNRGAGRLAVVGLACALVLAGCGGGSTSQADTTPSDTGVPSSTDTLASGGSDTTDTTDPTDTASTSATAGATYLPAPAGVSLTEPDTSRAYGKAATVAFSPRQDEVVSLYLSVVRVRGGAAKQVLGAFKLTDAQKRGTAYLVKVKVANADTTETMGVAMPLYAHSSDDTLVAATAVPDSFVGCRASDLPAMPVPRQLFQRCLVYLLPQGRTLTSIDFRPSADVGPISWVGPILPVRPRDTRLTSTKAGGAGGSSGASGAPKGN